MASECRPKVVSFYRLDDATNTFVTATVNCQPPRTCLATHKNKHSNGALAIRLFTFRRKIATSIRSNRPTAAKMTLHRLIFCRNIHKLFPSVRELIALVAKKWSEMFQIIFFFVCRSGNGTPHHQLQQCHRFTQTSRMRSPFEPKKSLGFVEQKLGENEKLRLPLSSLAKPLLFTAGVSQSFFVSSLIGGGSLIISF